MLLPQPLQRPLPLRTLPVIIDGIVLNLCNYEQIVQEGKLLEEMNCNKSSKVSSIGNWLQCRELIEGIGSSKGTICGKWRREIRMDHAC
ncbi:hypothetical protein GQ457_13G004140 [Hibiscus cannabinus]